MFPQTGMYYVTAKSFPRATLYNRTDWHSFQGLNRCANCLTAHPRAPNRYGGFTGGSKGFQIQNESCDCIKYLKLGEGCNGRTTAFDDPTELWKNGLPYLKPCLNTYKPIDIVILMLGTNDLKNSFNVSAKEIAEGAGKLVDVITEFTSDKQGFIPKIILVSPPEIGERIKSSPFSEKYDEDAIESSRSFPEYYKKIAEDKDCIFLKASDYAEPSKEDSLHLSPDGHKALAEALYKTIISNNC